MTSANNTLRLLRTAFLLSITTIGYNLIEGVVSITFSASEDTLTLFGFGVDSFIEVVSAVGIAHMIYRMRRRSIERWDTFEGTALRITGASFFILAAGLCIGSLIIVLEGITPSSTLPGVIIALVSIATMYVLYTVKLSTGRKLQSDAIIADAGCTKTCFYLSFILLVASGLHEFFQLPFVDTLGSLGIAWYAFKEGREAFEKAHRGNLIGDDCGDGE